MRASLLTIFTLLCSTLFAQTDSVYTEFDIAPVFKSKDSTETFEVWAGRQITNPQKKTITVEFVIEKNGKVSSVVLLDRESEELTQRVKRTLIKFSHWSPALVGGDTVRAKLVTSIKLSVLAPPQFEGGDINTFRQWVASNFVIPRSVMGTLLKQRVVVSVVIEKDGTLVVDKIVNNPNIDLTKEVLRVLGKSPKWKPATKDGVPISLKFNIPVDFNTK